MNTIIITSIRVVFVYMCMAQSVLMRSWCHNSSVKPHTHVLYSVVMHGNIRDLCGQ